MQQHANEVKAKEEKKRKFINIFFVIVGFIFVVSCILLIIANDSSPKVNGLKLKKVYGGYQVTKIVDENKKSIKIVAKVKKMWYY